MLAVIMLPRAENVALELTSNTGRRDHLKGDFGAANIAQTILVAEEIAPSSRGRSDMASVVRTTALHQLGITISEIPPSTTDVEDAHTTVRTAPEIDEPRLDAAVRITSHPATLELNGLQRERFAGHSAFMLNREPIQQLGDLRQAFEGELGLAQEPRDMTGFVEKAEFMRLRAASFGKV